MQDCDASDDVVSTNIDTTITPIRMGLLRLGSGTAPASKLLMGHNLKTEDCELFQVLKDNINVLLTMVSGMMMPSTGLIVAAMRPPAGKANRLHLGSQLSFHRAPTCALAVIDDGREVAATIIGDWPLVR